MLVLLMLGVSSGCDGRSECKKAADRIVDKYEECGIALGTGSEEEQCTIESARCLADCTEEASCETLKGNDPDGAEEFSGCIAGR